MKRQEQGCSGIRCSRLPTKHRRPPEARDQVRKIEGRASKRSALSDGPGGQLLVPVFPQCAYSSQSMMRLALLFFGKNGASPDECEEKKGKRGEPAARAEGGRHIQSDCYAPTDQ